VDVASGAPERLFVIATPIGVVVFALFLWLVRRS
jgi:hypothetical protein